MKVRTTRARRGATAAALALCTVLAVGACGQQAPDAAATVNGHVITEEQLSAIRTDMTALQSGGQEITNQDILITLLLRPFVVQAAQQGGHMVSESEARQALGPALANPSTDTVQFAQTSLISRKLPQQELVRVAQEFSHADISVNPRYGQVDPRQGIVPAQQNWIDTAASGSSRG